MKPKLLVMAMISLLIFSILASAANSADLAAAEKTAWRYMTSLFRGDVEMAFDLMDPRVLDRRKADIVKSYEFAKKQGKTDEFKARFKNIENLDSVLRLPAKQFFILMVKKDREKAPAGHLEAMRETVVNVMGSRRLNASTARVDLKISPPGAIGEAPQEESLIMTLYQGQWKVAENAK
ncbi:MAG: hypothetical protein P8X85_07470 [Desulfobacterales bacterium]